MLKKCCTLFLLLLPLTGSVCLADEPQASAPRKFYRLDFVMQEVDGAKIVNSRAYSATAATDSPIGCSIRASSDIHVAVGSIPNSTQYQLFSVGVNIDAGRLRESGSELALEVSVEVSSIPEETPPNSPPILRKNNWRSNLLIPLKKPTIIFSSDDLTTKHKMQMQLTATPVQ